MVPNKEFVVFGYFALSIIFMSVGLVAIYRLLRFPSRLQARFQSERSRKHAVSGCIFSVLFLLRVTSNAMSPFWVFTLSALYGVFILMAITGLYKVSIRHQWAVFQRRTREARIIGREKLSKLSSHILFFLSMAKQVVINLPFIYSSMKTLNILVNQAVFFILCSNTLHTHPSVKVPLYTLLFFSIINYVVVSLEERKWAKLDKIMVSEDSSNGPNQTGFLRLTGSYATSRLSRAIVTTFAVIIITIDFGQDADTKNGSSGIDYLLTTLLYYLISELKFDKPEDHAIVRYIRKLKLKSFGELEHIWIPMLCQLTTILSSLSFIFYILIHQTTFEIATLTGLAMYTNIRIPFEALQEKWCNPLERELNFASKMKKPSVQSQETNLKENSKSNAGNMFCCIFNFFGKLISFKNSPCFGQCPICLEGMHTAARITECSHTFHAHCLRKSLEIIGDSCPMCRKPILDSLLGEEQLQSSEFAYWHQQM